MAGVFADGDPSPFQVAYCADVGGETDRRVDSGSLRSRSGARSGRAGAFDHRFDVLPSVDCELARCSVAAAALFACASMTSIVPIWPPPVVGVVGLPATCDGM